MTSNNVLDLREHRIVPVVLFGLFLQFRSTLSHKRGHLVYYEPGVCILWRRDFKQAISISTVIAPMTKWQSQSSCTTKAGRRCTVKTKAFFV